MHEAEPPDTGSVDEVGFDVGEDEAARGLLDTWVGRTLPGAGRDGTGELTGSFSADEPPLTAVLARIAAGLGREGAADRFAASEGQPSRAVKALIADEPLDPLPVPEGLPLSGTGFLEVGGSTDITAVAGLEPVSKTLGPTPVPAPAVAEPVGNDQLDTRLLLIAIIVALAVGAIGAWLVLGG